MSRWSETSAHGASEHVGTTDVDLVIGLAIDDVPETYRTLQANLKKSGFRQTNLSYQWERDVDGVSVKVEFLCETDQVEPGRIYRPKEGTGSKLGAFNVPGAQLTTGDFVEHSLEADRLDDGGISRVTFRVAGILAYTVLKRMNVERTQAEATSRVGENGFYPWTLGCPEHLVRVTARHCQTQPDPLIRLNRRGHRLSTFGLREDHLTDREDVIVELRIGRFDLVQLPVRDFGVVA